MVQTNIQKVGREEIERGIEEMNIKTMERFQELEEIFENLVCLDSLSQHKQKGNYLSLYIK